MTTLLIVRHGYSCANKENRFSGQMDVPLNEVGRRQAEELGRYLTGHFAVDAVYASDLSRAYDTVKPIADALHLPVHTDAALREVDVGEWQGMLFEDVARRYPENFALYKRKPGLARFDGGESFAELLERAASAIGRIARENEGKTVVIGTHGGVIRTLRALWTGLSLERMEELPHVPNASLTVAEYESGTVTLREVGYCDFLTDRTAE